MYTIPWVITTRKRSLGQGNIFAPVCHSVNMGGVSEQVHPPGRYTPRRYTPWQVHPLAGTPPGQVHTPWQVHPLGSYTPWAGTHTPGRYTTLAGTPPWAGTPPRQVHFPGQVHHLDSACWDTVNKWAVRILLECILVWKLVSKINWMNVIKK